MAQVKKSNATSDGSNLCEYFPLTACVNGLSMLMKELFGIDLVTCKASEREIWHPDVTKVSIKENTSAFLVVHKVTTVPSLSAMMWNV